LDGELVWRFRAAPEDRRVVVYNQLESAWPVHGSVLVKDRIVYTAAGRSSYLDGGIHLYRLNLETGEKLSETIINSRDPQTHEQPDGIINRFEMPGLLSDILSSEDDYVYMRHVKFDLQGKLKNEFGRHLFSPTGFLDDTWWHRSYWLYGDEYEAGWANWWRAGNRTPSGRILVLNNECVYGYGRTFYPKGNAGQWNKGEQYHLFNMPIDQKKFDKLNTENGSIPSYNWITQLPFQVYSMVLTGEVLFIAGPAGEGHKSLKALQGEGGIDLWAVSAKTGKKLAEYQLTELPRFDGMIAANKKLFIAGQNGHLTCYGEVL
jgi:hypothetical protein